MPSTQAWDLPPVAKQPPLPDPERVGVRKRFSPWSCRGFWALQFVACPIVIAGALGPWLVVSVEEFRAQVVEALAVLIACACVFIASSSLLGRTYARLPEDWLMRPRIVPLILALCLVMSAPWTAAVAVLCNEMGWMQHRAHMEFFAVWFSSMSTFLLAGWSLVYLVYAFSQNARRTRERLLIAEALARQAQLKSLRAQVSPHFLFNSLNSIIGLVDVDPQQSKVMTRNLAALLRRALDSTQSDKSTIYEELDFIVRYLNCEGVRFDDMRVRIDVARSLLALPIPSLLLQPLVENAIKHGMRDDAPLEVEIVGRLMDQRVRIDVKNTGRLVPSLAIDEEGQAGTAELGEKGGAGLRLVWSRLQTCYPQSARFTLTQQAGWVIARLEYEAREDTRTNEEAPAAVPLTAGVEM